MNHLGVMQGRLLPKYHGRYQAHPCGYWKQEFPLAASLGLNCIEFILDCNDAEANPLLRSDGPDEICRLTAETGVAVHTICADYFIAVPLHHFNVDLASQGQRILRRLLHNGKTIGLTDIVIPCLEQSSLHERTAEDHFVRCMQPFVEEAEKIGINLALEVDLPPQRFAEMLTRFDSRRVTVNYDTGNSAALGFKWAEELACYGERISDVHIKDRTRGGPSVVLGNGAVQFEPLLDRLRSLQYQGPFILQAYRDDEGVAVFQRQFEWFLLRYRVNAQTRI